MNTAPEAIRSRVFYVLLLGLQEVSIKKICETAGSHHAGHFPVDFRRLFPEGAALCNFKRTRSGSTKEAFSDWIEEVEENEIQLLNFRFIPAWAGYLRGVMVLL